MKAMATDQKSPKFARNGFGSRGVNRFWGAIGPLVELEQKF